MSEHITTEPGGTSEHIVPEPGGSASENATLYERKDVNIPAILVIGGVLAVTVIISQLVSWWVFDYIRARDRETKTSPFPLAAQNRGQMPPNPRLEEIDRMEALQKEHAPARLYETEMRQLESFGWDEKTHTARIPIEKAMKIIVEQNRLRTREP